MSTPTAPVKPEERPPAAARTAQREARPASRRTTVALSPRALEIVEHFKLATGLSMSDAVSELIERSEPRPPRIKWVDGLPMADIPLTGKWITTEDVLRAEAEPW
ncbi:MAG: hypothetical protein WCE75_15960 [Terracidiphilus sp.]